MSKTVLITGATSGLGYEFVKMFSNDGYKMVLVARDQSKLEDIQQTYTNNNITIIPLDLTTEEAAKTVFDHVQKMDIEIDVLVNNAGFGLLGTFDELEIGRQRLMIQLNITALTELTYYFLNQMKKRNTGKILNVASLAAFQPGPFMAVYYATKAYVVSFSEALVEELTGTNITVTTLCPGPTQTNFGFVAKVENTKMFKRAMPAAKVAEEGYRSLIKGERVVVTGWMNKLGAIAAKVLPRRLAAKAAKYVAQEKQKKK